jgi:putative methionine-R-sulfoxide reductase with GAF domain
MRIGMNDDTHWNAHLRGILAEFGCQTGTLHRTAPDTCSLVLVCQIGVPDTLLEKISAIPFGKGIAGAAAERREPVRLCNLQQDLGGVARPDARQTGVSGSLAVPIFATESAQVIGTLGIGMTRPHDFTPEQEQRLEQHARVIAQFFEDKAARGD